jgi:hypothetical protein
MQPWPQSIVRRRDRTTPGGPATGQRIARHDDAMLRAARRDVDLEGSAVPSVQEPRAAHLAASLHAQTPHAQSEGNGAVIVDLDEAIFGLNALAREAFGIAQSGIGQAMVHWQQDAVAMGLDPMGWISASAYESDWSAIASTIAVSAVSLPFAALAIKGGIEEIRHGRAERQRLRLEQQLLMARQARAIAVADGADAGANAATKACGTPGLAQGLARKDAARLQRVGTELSAASATVSIGAAATSSGTFMSVNALCEMLLQPVLKCCSQGMSVAAWIAQHAVWSTIVSVLGTVATFVLAPLGALSATWLGSSFVHRSRIKCRQFLHAKGLLAAAMKPAGDPGVSAVAGTPYGRFLMAKLGKRAAFMLKFRNWSVAFLAGASTYTGGVLVKTALVGAALVGLGIVATNPIVLAVLSLVVTIGAVAMAIGSGNFIVNLGKVKRHEGYETLEHPQLDRELFDAMDPIGEAAAGEAQPLSQRAGFKERARVYGLMVAQETEIQRLVSAVAEDNHKRYVWTDRSDRDRYGAHQSTSASASRGKDLIAAIGAARVLVRGLLSGKGPAESWRAASTHYAGECASLKVHTLATALASTDPAALRERLCAITGIQSTVLQTRLAARRSLLDEPEEPPCTAFQTDSCRMPAQAANESARDWRQQQSTRHSDDLKLLSQLQDLQNAADARLAAVPTAHEEEKQARTDHYFIARFLELQRQIGLCTRSTHASAKPVVATQYAELAEYLLTQAPTGFASLRGSLLACEMDAARASAIPVKAKG